MAVNILTDPFMWVSRDLNSWPAQFTENPPSLWDGNAYAFARYQWDWGPSLLIRTADTVQNGDYLEGVVAADGFSESYELLLAVVDDNSGATVIDVIQAYPLDDGGFDIPLVDLSGYAGSYVALGVAEFSPYWPEPDGGYSWTTHLYGPYSVAVTPATEPEPPSLGYRILFEAIPPEAHSGGGGRPLSITSSGLGLSLLVGEGYGSRSLRLSLFGEGYDFVQDFAPAIPANGFHPLALSPAGEGYFVGGGSGERPLRITVRGFSSAAGGGAPPLRIVATGYDSAPVFAHAFLEDRMPEMAAYGGAWFIEAASNVNLDDGPFADYAVAVSDVLRLADSPAVLASFLRTVQSSVVLRDFAAAVFEREILADLTLDDAPEALLQLIVRVTDQLLLEDEGASLLSTLHTVVGALALRDSVRAVLQGEVPSELELSDLTEARLQALVEAASALYLDESVEHALTMFALADSSLTLSADVEHSLSALVEALSGVDFGVRIRIGDELFVGYAMNVRNAAVSEYHNYPFNSMAVVGGVPYGAGPDGIYRLEGDDDEGDPINARVRTAALAFGHLARVPYARIVFTSDGDLLFKTITMDKGARKENTYKMAKRPLGTAVESRFTMAKGVTGSVWAFELSNVDGAYFEADALQVWTLQLDRRYSGR